MTGQSRIPPQSLSPPSRNDPPGKERDRGLSPVILWGTILAALLAGLAFVLLFILPNCATLPVWGKVTGECGTEKTGIIAVCSLVFLAGGIYSAYRLLAAGVHGKRR